MSRRDRLLLRPEAERLLDPVPRLAQTDIALTEDVAAPDHQATGQKAGVSRGQVTY